jgi:Flp pilus assembly protein TadG
MTAEHQEPALQIHRRFWRDASGASAVEFAIVSGPFILLVLCVLQVGLYYMTQSSLDTGVIRTADALRNSFTQAATPTLPNATTLKSSVVSNSGGMISNNLSVEIRELSDLTGGSVPITDGINDYGDVTSTLVVRAQASAVTFVPGFSALIQARSSAIVRRQNH